MKKFLIAGLALCLLLCGCAHAEMTAQPTVYEEPLLSYLVDAENGTYTPLLAAWYAPFEEAIELLPRESIYDAETGELDPFLVQEMPNGHMSVAPQLDLVFGDSDEVYSTVYVFSEEGLYSCCLRHIFKGESDLREKLAAISNMIVETLGETDSDGNVCVTDFSRLDLEKLRLSNVWKAEDGSFVRFQMIAFMGSVIVDVETGLLEYFPPLQDIGNNSLGE